MRSKAGAPVDLRQRRAPPPRPTGDQAVLALQRYAAPRRPDVNIEFKPEEGTPPEQVAKETGAALRTPPRADHGTNTLAVIKGHNLTQGAFAQRVASRYLSMFGTSVVADCNRAIDTDVSEGSLTKQRLCSQPFFYTADNLMGGAEPIGSPHEHDVAPRHVRHLSALVEAKMGGVWNPVSR